AKLPRPSRRMERIAKTKKAGDLSALKKVVGHHACDPPAHRFAADDEWAALHIEFGDGGLVLRIERFGTRRRLAARLGAAAGPIGEFGGGRPEGSGWQGPLRA